MTKNRTPDVLSRNQLKAVECLISYDSVADAAKACGLARDTVYRYLKIPEFDHELKKAKRTMVDQAVTSLQRSCKDAAEALAQICKDKDSPPSARVAAAREILAQTMKAVEIENIEDRLKALEDRLNLN